MGLYSRLFRYRARERREPLEDFLSEALADFLARAPQPVVRSFLTEALGIGRDAEGLLSGNESLIWHTQFAVEKPRRCYLDIMLEVDGQPFLVIENKIGSSIRQHGGEDENKPNQSIGTLNQLTSYGEWISGASDPEWGGALVFLTHRTDPPDDFLLDPHLRYRASHRSVVRWSTVGDWLARYLQAGADGHPPVCQVLGTELLEFLKEKHMVSEPLSLTDIAALQVFLPTSERIRKMFSRAWSNSTDLRRDWCSSRLSKVDIGGYPGIVWSWNYTQSPPALSGSYISLGLRFPEQTDWWQGHDLPSHPHAFMFIGSDDGNIPVDKVTTLPKGWTKLEDGLVAAQPLSSFPGETEKFSEAFAEWARNRILESREIFMSMSEL